jgi:DNA repair protein RecO (recombination protein O)
VLADDYEAAYYGMYFCELADYYTVEYLEAAQILKLLYKTLSVLSGNRIPRELIRYIFELKLLQLNGEAPFVSCCSKCKAPLEGGGFFSLSHRGLLCFDCGKQASAEWRLEPSTVYTLQFITCTPVEKLYTFLVKEEVLQDLRKISKYYFLPNLDKNMKSLAVLEDCLKLSGFYT